MIVTGYLIVRSDGSMRVNKKAVRLATDEVAFPVTVQIPDTWGSVQEAAIKVVMPEPPPSTVTVGDPEVPDDESLQEI